VILRETAGVDHSGRIVKEVVEDTLRALGVISDASLAVGKTKAVGHQFNGGRAQIGADAIRDVGVVWLVTGELVRHQIESRVALLALGIIVVTLETVRNYTGGEGVGDDCRSVKHGTFFEREGVLAEGAVVVALSLVLGLVFVGYAPLALGVVLSALFAA
jgi:hypothetical protein